MKENSYTISRNDSAKFLKISIRTLDRYVKSGKLSIKDVDGRVFLNIEELKTFNKKSGTENKKTVYRQKSKIDHRQNDDFVYSKKPKSVVSEAIPLVGIVCRQNAQNDHRQNDDFVYTEDDKKPEKSQSEKPEKNYDSDLEDLKKQLQENIEFQQYKEKALLSELSVVQMKKNEFEKVLKLEKIKRSFFLILLLMVLAFQPIWIYLVFFR